jgi:predicted rRNA methylase YqxC with S4 and FtsJ domains
MSANFRRCEQIIAMTKTSKPKKQKLGDLLVARGLCADLEEARRSIWAGEVIVNEEMVDQPAARVPVDANIRLRRKQGKYVSRGGEKLEAALKEFAVPVEGRVALDIGASTGGFTDCLLAHGASLVYAVDVGRGQLAQRLHLNPKVVDLGGQDVLAMDLEMLFRDGGAWRPATLGSSDASSLRHCSAEATQCGTESMSREPRRAGFTKPAPTNFKNDDECSGLEQRPTLATVDVTFRSLAEVLPKVRELLTGEREIVALLKPLFEARLAGMGRAKEVQRHVFEMLLPKLAEQGLPVQNIITSPLPGSGGAVEFFLHIKAPGRGEEELQELVEEALAKAKEKLSEKTGKRRTGQNRRKYWARRGRASLSVQR